MTFDRAVQALSGADYAAAEKGFLTVLRREPNNVGAIGNLGILYGRTNRNDKAIAEYQRALQLSPRDEAILLDLGLAYLKEEQHGRALPLFERVLAIDPGHQQARQLRDLCRIYTGQVPSAIRDLEQLRAGTPNDQQLLFLLGFAYLKNGDDGRAKAIFQRMFDAAGPAQAQFLLGKASYEAGKFPQAEESLLAVLHTDDHFPGIHLELGKVYSSERRTEEAIREWREALQDNANDQEANYYLGSLLVRENQAEEGVGYLEKARNLKPDSYAVYLSLGRAELRLRKTAEAAAYLRKASELNPDDGNVQYTLARALKANGQSEDAARAFEKARKLIASAQDESKIPGLQ